MKAKPAVTIITTCKGRKAHLSQTLSTMLSQNFDGYYDIIVVDYGDPDNSYDWIASLGNERVRAIRVIDNTKYFNLSRARNCSVAFTAAEILCFVDADMLLGDDWLTSMTEPILRKDAALTFPDGKNKMRGMGGSIAVAKQAWGFVRGYDEAFNSWGPERKDFERRIEEYAPIVGVKSFNADLVDHDDQLRMKFYPDSDKQKSRSRLHTLMENEGRAVNPMGFGVAFVLYKQHLCRIANSRVTSQKRLPNRIAASRILNSPDVLTRFNVFFRGYHHIAERSRKMGIGSDK
jgi:glycosyltransferase involved in cell wall biosynthesis